MHTNINLIEHVAGVLRDMLGDDFDSDTFLDTLDGETDVMDIVGRLVADREEAKAFAAASKAIAAEYDGRARRLTDKAAAIAKALGAVLDATGEKKIAHPLATISRTKGRRSCLITDESAVPTQLCRTTVTPDRTAILAALEAGETIPGAEIQIGDPGVSVRVK